jgi:hypothetical protein
MSETIGFLLIPAINLETVYNDMLNNGSCCLAYGDNTDKHIEMLLTDETRSLRNRKPEEVEFNDRWTMLDQEIVQALIGLRMMANCELTKLYWCQNCRVIAAEPTDCACTDTFEDGTGMVTFGIDFTN